MCGAAAAVGLHVVNDQKNRPTLVHETWSDVGPARQVTLGPGHYHVTAVLAHCRVTAWELITRGRTAGAPLTDPVPRAVFGVDTGTTTGRRQVDLIVPQTQQFLLVSLAGGQFWSTPLVPCTIDLVITHG